MVDRDLHLLMAAPADRRTLPKAHHPPARHAGGVQHLDPVIDRLLANLGVDERVDLGAPREAAGVGAKSG
jgi:hypothetical protein